MNHVVLNGRLTRDLELRQSVNGTNFVYFSLAVDNYRNQTQPTDFIPCVAWGELAKRMCTYLHKGSPILVNGKLRVRKDEKKAMQQVMEVVIDNFEFLESKARAQQAGNQLQNDAASFSKELPTYDMKFTNDNTDAIDEAIDW